MDSLPSRPGALPGRLPRLIPRQSFDVQAYKNSGTERDAAVNVIYKL